MQRPDVYDRDQVSACIAHTFQGYSATTAMDQRVFVADRSGAKINYFEEFFFYSFFVSF